MGKISGAKLLFLASLCKTLSRWICPRGLDDALAQPTRAQLFTVLSDLRRPASTDELAERLALHPNGVRMHLERLREAGLVTRERPRQARGRPRDMWMVAPDARPGGDPPSAYADLGRWLARAIAPGKTELARGRGGRTRDRPRPRAPGRSASSRGDDARRARLARVSARAGGRSRGNPNLPAVQLPVPRCRAREPAGRVHLAPRHDPRPARRHRSPDASSPASSRATPTPPAASSSCAAGWPTKRSRRPQRQGSPTSRDNAACREHGGARRDPRRACHARWRPPADFDSSVSAGRARDAGAHGRGGLGAAQVKTSSGAPGADARLSAAPCAARGRAIAGDLRAGARHDVLKRLARPEGPCQR